MKWEPIETHNLEPGTTHFRGVWVTVNTHCPQKPPFQYWEAVAGYIDDETGEFLTATGDDPGWRGEDFTHWMPLPPPPEAL